MLHKSNCYFHCSTATDDVQSMIVLFLMVQATEIPTNVFPAPHGRTIIPDLDLLPLNILDNANYWYVRIVVVSFSSV